jgi:hypothetical protein
MKLTEELMFFQGEICYLNLAMHFNNITATIMLMF